MWTSEISKERLLLLGQNGCGKTTAAAAGPAGKRLFPEISSSGAVTRSGKPVSATGKPNREWFRKVGSSPESKLSALYADGFQEIAFGAVSEDYAREIMEQLASPIWPSAIPIPSPEGQKRRVSIAAVAAPGPRCCFWMSPRSAGLQGPQETGGDSEPDASGDRKHDDYHYP